MTSTTAPFSLAAEHREHTKSLSPFGDVVDKTPVIRSVVLKLLLKYRSVALVWGFVSLCFSVALSWLHHGWEFIYRPEELPSLCEQTQFT